MSDAIQCDKCGKFFTERDCYVRSINCNVRADNREVLYRLELKTSEGDGINVRTRRMYDLCNDCWMLFLDFVNDLTPPVAEERPDQIG